MPDHDLAGWRARVDAALDRALPDPDTPPHRLHAAMRHATLLGGKRMRPLLVYASGTMFDAAPQALDTPAVAVELIHAYSLVHDDLPCMDDDALRRGQPTVHVAFDEATAVLAGDALQTLAFELLSDTPVPDAIRLALIRTLAGASGAAGMCGGQALDLEATGQKKRGQSESCKARIHSDPFPRVSVSALRRLHALKTGALIRAAVRMGALCAGAPDDALTRLDLFSNALGLAFQVRDDILDIESDSATLGKTAGKDQAQAKATFPALLGMGASRELLSDLAMTMDDALAGFGEQAAMLAALGRLAIERDR